MNQRTVYFENADRPDTIVRKRPNVFELEYISRQCSEWKKAAPNSSYEREYYLGEGNCCLFHISEEEAKKRLEEVYREKNDALSKD